MTAELGVAIAALGVSTLTFLSVVLDRSERFRYREFLVRIHKDAANEQERVRDTYAAPTYPVPVSEDELDLAFRALAEDIIHFSDGRWKCRPARFTKASEWPPPPPGRASRSA